MGRRFTTTLAGCLLLAALRPAVAQEATRVTRAGDRVRVTRCEAGSTACRSTARVDGILLAETGEGLTVQVDASALQIPWTAVRHVARYEGHHGAVWSFAFVFGGLVVGSVLGVATGLLVQGDCYEAGCLAGPVYGFLVGAPAGLIAGITVASLTHHRWRTVYEGPVRVSVGPVGTRAGRGIGVGVAIPIRP